MHCVRASLRDVRRLLRQSGALELSAGAVRRLRCFAYFLEHGGSVSLTCRHFGMSRSTFIRWAGTFRVADPSSLEEQPRCPKNVRAPETDEHAVSLIRSLRKEQPLMGRHEIARMLREKHGVALSVSTVGRVIARHRFFFADTKAHRDKRLQEILSADDAGSAARRRMKHDTQPESDSFPLHIQLDFPSP